MHDRSLMLDIAVQCWTEKSHVEQLEIFQQGFMNITGLSEVAKHFSRISTSPTKFLKPLNIF